MIVVIIILLILGIAAIVASIFADRIQKEDKAAVNRDEYLEQLLEERINQVENHIGDVAEKSATTMKKRAKQELEKLSKEKLSEVNEYSDQVMEQINKNHSEVMFLYGLLSDKQKQLDETVESLNRAQKELQISQRLNLREERNEKWVDETEKTGSELKIESEKDKKTSEVSDINPDIQSDKGNDLFKNQPEEKQNESTKEEGGYGRRAQIIMLSKEGKNEFEIAKQLEMGVGEVKLVLELSKGD